MHPGYFAFRVTGCPWATQSRHFCVCWFSLCKSIRNKFRNWRLHPVLGKLKCSLRTHSWVQTCHVHTPVLPSAISATCRPTCTRSEAPCRDTARLEESVKSAEPLEDGVGAVGEQGLHRVGQVVVGLAREKQRRVARPCRVPRA